MNTAEFLERLDRAVNLSGADAGIRFSAQLQPAGGAASKVFPPTYKSDDPYVREKRYRDDVLRDTVLLDAQQSQANRVEAALSEAIDDGVIAIPHLRMTGQVEGWRVSVTNLTAPHRGPDAYFRDAEDADGVAFDQTSVGEALRRADAQNATAFLEFVPTDLLYGFWDSQRGGRGVKVARSYTSEIIGWDPEVGQRSAGKVDPNNIETVELIHPDKKPGEFRLASDDEKVAKGFKKVKPSAVGHGNIPPSPQRNSGVAISSAERLAYLSFAGLHRLRFPSAEGGPSAARNIAGRTLLAGLALYADRLAFDRPALLLRSGCELVVESDRVQWLDRRGVTEDFDLDLVSARAIFEEAVQRARAAGLSWVTEPTSLVPKKQLVDLLAATFTKYADVED